MFQPDDQNQYLGKLESLQCIELITVTHEHKIYSMNLMLDDSSDFLNLGSLVEHNVLFYSLVFSDYKQSLKVAWS